MDRFTLAIVIGVLALVVAGIGAAIVVRGREMPPDLATPAGVTLAYAQAIQQADGAQAWDLLASSVQRDTDRDEFLRKVAGRVGGRQDRARLVVEGVRVEGETARVDLVRMFPASGGLFSFGDTYSTRSVVTLVRESGQWRITIPPEPYLLPARERR